MVVSIVLNEKEQRVLKLVRNNPFLSQQEMADQLKMSRPSLANIISGLIRKGKIIGRAYVLPTSKEIICIGGANIDRKFHVAGEVAMGTSNPSNVTQSIGGVARNIAENLGRLGQEVRLITLAGHDSDWKAIEKGSSHFMKLDSVELMEDITTGSYTAVLNEQGELIIAMANMAIYDRLRPSNFKKHESWLLSAQCIVVDLNCPLETVEYLRDFAALHHVPLMVVPVSSPKMNRLPKNLDGVTWLICNREEAEMYLDFPIQSREDYHTAIELIKDKGVEYAVITSGDKGVYAGSKESETFYVPAIAVEHVEDVTGAGDAFVSAFLHVAFQDQAFKECIRSGLVNASKTLQSPFTVRQDLSSEQLQKELEE